MIATIETVTRKAKIDKTVQSGAPSALPEGFIRGDFWLDSEPVQAVALWGFGDDVLWARGEPCMICGGDGSGKTTLSQNLIIRLIGIEPTSLFGFPVAEVGTVLYIAADRPQQAKRALRRLVGSMDKQALADRLVIWEGPLPEALETNPKILVEYAQKVEADLVIIDSLKDVAVDLVGHVEGNAISRAFQLVIAADIELLINHHDRKAQPKEKVSLDLIYGSRLTRAACGSIVYLAGQAPAVTFHHLKRPANEIPPFDVIYDAETGSAAIEHGTSPLDILRDTGRLTAVGAAKLFYKVAKPSKAEKMRAERVLKNLENAGHARSTPGAEKNEPTTWTPAHSQTPFI